ncbi:MAG: acetate uptake transporter [Gaiellaceae bacterium]
MAQPPQTDTTANPAPLGLAAFGITTFLLNVHNAGFYELNGMVLAMGFFYGGIAQVIAGLMEWRKGNTFGTTAFTSYGLFWLSLVGLLVIEETVSAWETDATATGWYLLAWGVFTALLFGGTLRINRALQVVFAGLAILFFLLASAEWSDSSAVAKAAGAVGIVVGAAAVYTAIAQIWNELYGRTILPLGTVAPRNTAP